MSRYTYWGVIWRGKRDLHKRTQRINLDEAQARRLFARQCTAGYAVALVGVQVLPSLNTLPTIVEHSPNW